MDFRGISKCSSTRLETPSTVLTPQLNNYEIFRGFSDPFLYDEKDLFVLVFNLSSLKESELKITRMRKSAGQDVLQVEVVHSRREVEGVPPFARNCTYQYILPEKLHDKTLTAFWTLDQYVVLVESTNLIDAPVETAVAEEHMDEDIKVDAEEIVIRPRKVDFMFKSSVNIDVVRRAVEMAELGLFNAKRIIQNGSFACPDINRLGSAEKKDGESVLKKNDTSTSKKETNVVIKGFYQRCIDNVVVKQLAETKEENSSSETGGK